MTRNCLNVMRKVATGDIEWPDVPNFDVNFPASYLLALGDRSQMVRDAIDHAQTNLDREYNFRKVQTQDPVVRLLNKKENIDSALQRLRESYARRSRALAGTRDMLRTGEYAADLTGVGLTGGGAVLGGLAGAGIAGEGNRLLGGLVGAGVGAGAGYGAYRIAKYLAGRALA